MDNKTLKKVACMPRRLKRFLENKRFATTYFCFHLYKLVVSECFCTFCFLYCFGLCVYNILFFGKMNFYFIIFTL